MDRKTGTELATPMKSGSVFQIRATKSELTWKLGITFTSPSESGLPSSNVEDGKVKVIAPEDSCETRNESRFLAGDLGAKYSNMK